MAIFSLSSSMARALKQIMEYEYGDIELPKIDKPTFLALERRGLIHRRREGDFCTTALGESICDHMHDMVRL